MSEILSKMKAAALKADIPEPNQPVTILTLLRCAIAVSILSLIVINSMGFGLGYSNMKIYYDMKSRGSVEEAHLVSKCLPPHNKIVKYLVPGFQLGCSAASALENK